MVELYGPSHHGVQEFLVSAERSPSASSQPCCQLLGMPTDCSQCSPSPGSDPTVGTVRGCVLRVMAWATSTLVKKPVNTRLRLTCEHSVKEERLNMQHEALVTALESVLTLESFTQDAIPSTVPSDDRLQSHSQLLPLPFEL